MTTRQPSVLITGGGSGIGAAIAGRLHASGWQIAVCGRRPEPLQQIKDRLGALAMTADVSDEVAIQAAVITAVQRFDGLDAVVCAAGTSAGGTVAEQTLERFEQVVAVNLTGAFLTMRAALPHLVASRGALVTIGSLAGLAAPPASAAYASSKAALAMLTQSVAVDFGGRGVRANCVCPGWIRTELADIAMDELAQLQGTDREGAYRVAGSASPSGRVGDAREVAELVAYLVGPGGSYVNGAVIPVDGGASALDPGALAFRDRAGP